MQCIGISQGEVMVDKEEDAEDAQTRPNVDVTPHAETAASFSQDYNDV